MTANTPLRLLHYFFGEDRFSNESDLLVGAFTWIDCCYCYGIHGLIILENDEAWHPLPGAPLRFRLRFVATLRLQLRAGSGLPSAVLLGISISVVRILSLGWFLRWPEQ